MILVLIDVREPLPEPPKNPIRVLHDGVAAALAVYGKPAEYLSEKFAFATAGLAQAWPEFAAATIFSVAVGLPHKHLHIPVLPPLPPIGTVLFGCASVLICGKPAARVGDVGVSPTCLGIPVPGFEIFTGSSKVFVGGARAARRFDVTMHCWPDPTKALKLFKPLSKVVSAVNKVEKVLPYIGFGVQAVKVGLDVADAVTAEDAAVAEAAALSASVGVAQLAMDAAAFAMSKLFGKCIGPPMGAILTGESTVQIGGFPVPSGQALLMRQLSRVDIPPQKPRGSNDATKQGPKRCGR